MKSGFPLKQLQGISILLFHEGQNKFTACQALHHPSFPCWGYVELCGPVPVSSLKNSEFKQKPSERFGLKNWEI